MISDVERREVARRLRALHLGGGSKDLIERTLSDAIGAWRRSGMSWDFITERLADLIEPVERMCLYYDADTNHCGCYDTRLIDRDALLNLADTLDLTRETDCRGCRLEGAGCAECSSGVAHEAARRIRKALGVE